jgi:hypothetical protein
MHHLAEAEHEHFGVREGDPDSAPVDQHVSLGMRPNEHQVGLYLPGQTIHLTDEQAEEMIAQRKVAPRGATVRYEMRLDSEL